MALNRPNLSIENTVNDQCTGITLADTTGQYNITTNPEGYGLPGGPLSNDVTSLEVVVRNESTGTYFTYAFVISLGVVQSCTLSIQGGTPTDISTEVGAIPWPFDADDQFNLFDDYGVTLPSFEDGVWQVEYTIEGSALDGGVSTPFSYTTSETFLVNCEITCCIGKMYAKLDPNCPCSDEGQKNADKAYAFLQAATYASQYGKTEEAIEALKKAQELCDCNCKDC
jgi:hypothetical protein